MGHLKSNTAPRRITAVSEIQKNSPVPISRTPVANMWRLIVTPCAFFSCAKRRRRATNAGQMRRMRRDIPQNPAFDRAEKTARRSLPEMPGGEPPHYPVIATSRALRAQPRTLASAPHRHLRS